MSFLGPFKVGRRPLLIQKYLMWTPGGTLPSQYGKGPQLQHISAWIQITCTNRGQRLHVEIVESKYTKKKILSNSKLNAHIVSNYLLLPFSISIIIICTSLMPNLQPCYCLNRTLLHSCLVNAMLSSFIVDLRQLKPTIEAIKNYILSPTSPILKRKLLSNYRQQSSTRTI